MGQFQINNKQNMDYTLVANSFIDNFLSDANDAQIKVYLFLLRHINLPHMCSISAMADFFNYTEKDVIRALTYWERKQVLSLSYNDKQDICGIGLCSFTEVPKNQPKPEATKESLSQKPVTTVATCLSTTSAFSKPEYTLDQLAEYKSRETTSELMFIAESYLRKTLSANDIRSLLFISDALHFSFDLIDYLLQYCVDRGKRDFRYIEKVAISWAEAHIETSEQAQKQAMKYDKDTYTVMNALGKNNQPTPKEAEYIKRWYQIYGFTSDVYL